MSQSSPAASGFFELVGRLRRSAATSSRYGQTDELQALADEFVRWQAHVRTEICRALEVNPPTSVSWETMIERVRNEHNRAESSAPWPLDHNPTFPVGPTEDALNGDIRP